MAAVFVKFLVCFVAASWFVQVNGELISNLPGLEATINFKQYSGYITVDEVKKTRLFYWYVESQSNPATDPLVLWLNGGPGCSSLAGFFGELGPFYVKNNSKLGINEYSWNKIANMIFLEAPAGVGFSKTDIPIAYNDDKTANDSLQFLIKFFEMFPHLRSLDFWMTGESYAGHYIPTLASKVIEHNKGAADVINLKGLMIGNPLTHLTLNNGATVEYVYSHHLISIGTYEALHQYCDYTFPNVLALKQTPDPAKCNTYEDQAAAEMGQINPYDIYSDLCLSDGFKSRSNGLALLNVVANTDLSMSTFARGILKSQNLRSPYDPCQDNYLQDYLNDPKVKNAIYAEAIKWSECNDQIFANWSLEAFAASMVPYYTKELFPAKLKILIYSGDVDSVVPATSTRYWLHMLHLNNTKHWHPWMDSRGQVGGYTSSTNEVTYATVRDAGHQVPTFQPLRAFNMFSRFLRGMF